MPMPLPWPRRATLFAPWGAALLMAGCASLPAPRLACDDSLKAAFKPDAETSVLLVRQFRTGEALQLSGTPDANTRRASADVCVVKLNVGPGNPGPAGAPSTSPGIGIEVWLPSPGQWNERIHVKGGGGWAGGGAGSVTVLDGVATSSSGSAATTAMVEGAVSAVTDTGHAGLNGSFAMLPDGGINTALWRDFAERGVHEMAVKTKALTRAFYGRAARRSYWNGFSTGGRQGLKLAQAHPRDFDGILAGAPAINWTSFITSELYPQIVMQRDLGGALLKAEQLALVSNAAIAACDVVDGRHLGYIPDPAACAYDATRDPAVLCSSSGGSNGSAACVNGAQATAINKLWFGQTRDGSAPPPASNHGFAPRLSDGQLWYGLARGTDLTRLAGNEPFLVASDMVALALQNPRLATPVSRGGPFTNATGNGANGWMALSYADLARAHDRGIALQAEFGHINTDIPDLGAFAGAGGKLLMYHGLADTLIMPQGSIHYYDRVVERMGGIAAVQRFYRFYLVPAMAHGFANGTSNPAAHPPLPSNEQLYEALTRWVEAGSAPGPLQADTRVAPVKSRPLCVYPQKAIHTAGDPNLAASYRCG